ncbi:MAG: hypothetical protein ACRENP_05075 [Longimicrobiales bacterium]
MTGFTRSPRVQKGAIIGLDPFNPVASIIVFQYNPETLTRTLSARTSGGGDGSDTTEALRFKGPPEETIDLSVEIDATDQLEKAQFPATTLGITPTLASLEMLLYPKTALVIANAVLTAAGIIEIIPPEAPLTLFVWGPSRILPVRLTRLTITEEAYDPNLNPIRAKVDLGLKVLSYHDLGLLSAGGALFLAHQVIKEVMAGLGGAATITSGLSASASVSAGS